MRLPAIRASRLALILVVVLASAGAFYLGLPGRSTTACVAAADLPAFHQLEERDVTCLALPTRSVGSDAIDNSELISGRYTLRATAKDSIISGRALGPLLPADTLDGMSILALPYDSTTAVGGTLAAGDTAVVMVPREETGTVGRLDDVLVLAVRKEEAAVILALDRIQRELLLERGSVQDAVLLRTQPYVVPTEPAP